MPNTPTEKPQPTSAHTHTHISQCHSLSHWLQNPVCRCSLAGALPYGGHWHWPHKMFPSIAVLLNAGCPMLQTAMHICRRAGDQTSKRHAKQTLCHQRLNADYFSCAWRLSSENCADLVVCALNTFDANRLTTFHLKICQFSTQFQQWTKTQKSRPLFVQEINQFRDDQHAAWACKF